MPHALSRCAEPGCHNLVAFGQGRCGAHQLKRPGTTAYLTPRWRNLSAKVRRERPRCEYPGCGRPSTDVHHLDGLGLDGPAAFERSNLMALCHGHHSTLTGQAKGRA